MCPVILEENDPLANLSILPKLVSGCNTHVLTLNGLTLLFKTRSPIVLRAVVSNSSGVLVNSISSELLIIFSGVMLTLLGNPSSITLLAVDELNTPNVALKEDILFSSSLNCFSVIGCPAIYVIFYKYNLNIKELFVFYQYTQ